ncbi:MAG: glycosyltransferase family 2 protein [Microbacteriaceae bacterium]|jgi:GT2 family glycosyltransferase|nr:glycosyltransferase family 2 protein [Microbacteriaceae bacterium]
MQQRVTAILVARSGAEYLERTLAALDAQTRRPELLIAVDAGSGDLSGQLLAASVADRLVAARDKSTFGQAVALAVEAAPLAGTDNEWLWLLAHDNAPEPEALAQLLAAVEIAPSVSVAGPKLMRWSQSDVIAEFGESMTVFGRSLRLVEGELDQAQHDVQNDALAVAAGGMLVRRSVWTMLGGFDPGLPSIDAALDFSVRARLAGHRVIVVPGARIASAGGPEHFGRPSLRETRRTRITRAAQLHRRLVYSPPLALPLHWLSLVPLAIIRSLLHLLAKRPGAIGPEFAAAFRTAFGGLSVARARRNLRRTKRLSWQAIAPLRVSWHQAAEQRAHRNDQPFDATASDVHERVGFVGGGGIWAVVAVGLIGLIAFGGLLGSSALTGGGLLPLSADLGSLWEKVGYGWRGIGAGFVGAADPFAHVLAVLGSMTFWQPSVSIVVFYFLALPVAALGAWYCARRIGSHAWSPALAAVLWAVAPPLLESLNGGHLGATIAHVALPWLVLLALNGKRSWAAAAGAALAFAGVAASAPVLVPALLVLWAAWLVASPRGAHRLLAIPLPAAALFAPLVFDQIGRGNLLALIADPGVPTAGATASGIQLVLGAPEGGSNGWTLLLERLTLPSAAGPFVVAALLLPLAALALIGLFLRGNARAIPALAVALLGYVTAVLASRIDVSSIGAEPVGVWAGSGISLFWLGLISAALVALSSIGRAANGSAVLVGVASVLVSIPLISAGLLGASDVRPAPERLLPAFVDAEAEARPDVGTLFLTPQTQDAIEVDLQRGRGTGLDDQSTLDATATTLNQSDAQLATLAGNLASRGGYDSARDLDELAIGFVVLVEARGEEADAMFTRAREALDGNPLFVPVGETTSGLLWRYVQGDDSPAPSGPGNTDTVYGAVILAVQGLIVGLTVLLAIPTTRPRRHSPAGSGEPAKTFDEESDD